MSIFIGINMQNKLRKTKKDDCLIIDNHLLKVNIAIT